MRIVIDMQGAQTESRFRGVGRYSLSLALAIVRNRGEHEILLALNGLFPDTIEHIRAAFYGLLPQENIRVWYAIGPVCERDTGNNWRRKVAEYIREAFLVSLRPDVVYISSLFEGYADDAVTSVGVFAPQIPTVVTLYDLIPFLNPESYLKSNQAYSKYYQRKIEHLRHANLWLAISESSAEEGRSVLALPVDAVVNISAACDPIFQRMENSALERRQVLMRFGITQPFLFYSGGADPHKNLHRLIRSFAKLPKLLRDTYQLVLAGRMPVSELDKLRKTAKFAGVREGQLCFVGYVTDEDLAQLYNLCAVFVLPSLHEGFGLPALEAMSCGAAVIGSNTTSVPEVIGCQDALFDPSDEMAISRKLVQVLGDSVFRASLVAHGQEQVKKFSWDESARRAVRVIESFCSAWIGGARDGVPENLLPDLTRAIAAVVPSCISGQEMLSMAHALSHILMDAAPKQLLVDISGLVQRDDRTGIQRVTRSILKELLGTPPEGYVVRPVYASTNAPGYIYARSYVAGFCGVAADLADEPIDYRPGDIFLGLDLQHYVVSTQKEYLIAVRRVGVEVFFVVYDLLPVVMPHVFPSHMKTVHEAWLYDLMCFDGVICISRAVAKEFLDWQRAQRVQRLSPFRIGWFHLGADIENSVPTFGLSDDASRVLKALEFRPTFLMVGTLEPRKGQAQALDAFDLLWEQGVNINLVIVGKQGWMVEELANRLCQHVEMNKRLFWLERASDEYLENIYAVSTCLIAASEGEGFGLPLIEAAQHKLPIIARSIPVFREVAGEYAYYFSSVEPGALAKVIREWMALHEKGCVPPSGNMPWITWKESTKRLLGEIINPA